jgi:hypothetical protein
MGRYYTGDINGKFWFGVQDSQDASFFGGTETDPGYKEYFFSKDDIRDIEQGIWECNKELRGYKTKMTKFFKKNSAYSDEMLLDAGIPANKIRTLLEWYARLLLGQKILKCVQKTGQCSFEAEL